MLPKKGFLLDASIEKEIMFIEEAIYYFDEDDGENERKNNKKKSRMRFNNIGYCPGNFEGSINNYRKYRPYLANYLAILKQQLIESEKGE